MKRVAADEHPTIAAVPDVVGVVVVAVQPKAIVIAFHAEHLQVAVRIGLHKTSSVTPPFECSRG
ncbi:hypothetical protein HYT45_03030 [Candidatus Uhrbacteria bacterium]|nr:hypothetical protein [Candidatus Uhrbacteria bacterium]